MVVNDRMRSPTYLKLGKALVGRSAGTSVESMVQQDHCKDCKRQAKQMGALSTATDLINKSKVMLQTST